MKRYRIVYRYGSNSPWIEVYSNNSVGRTSDVFQHLREKHRHDPQRHFRVQVLISGEYHTIEI